MKSIRKIFGSLSVVIVLAAMAIMFMGSEGSCEVQSPPTSSYQDNAKANEEVVKDLVKDDTLPKVTKSLERENLKRRIEFINQPDRIGYLYLLSDSGQLIKEVQVLGKVSSLNSYLTPMEDVQWYKGVDLGDGYGDVPIVTQAADLDGTYGENASGIFWFTPDGVYQEWNQGYFYSAERMTFTTKPLLVEQVKN